MDDIDYKILRFLQRDAKIPNTALAEMVALSPSACLRRVQHMEQHHIIDRYTTIVNGKSVGKGVQIILTVTLIEQSNTCIQQFEQALGNIAHVMSCYLVGGSYDYLIRLAVKDLDEYADLHRHTLSHLPHVANLQSNFAIREVLHRTEYAF